MVSLVETGSLEDDSRREKYPANMTATFRADCQRLIRHFLPGFESMITCFALIFIGWHTVYHLYVVRKNSGTERSLIEGNVSYYYSSLLLHCCQSQGETANNLYSAHYNVISWQKYSLYPFAPDIFFHLLGCVASHTIQGGKVVNAGRADRSN